MERVFGWGLEGGWEGRGFFDSFWEAVGYRGCRFVEVFVVEVVYYVCYVAGGGFYLELAVFCYVIFSY